MSKRLKHKEKVCFGRVKKGFDERAIFRNKLNPVMVMFVHITINHSKMFEANITRIKI